MCHIVEYLGVSNSDSLNLYYAHLITNYKYLFDKFIMMSLDLKSFQLTCRYLSIVVPLFEFILVLGHVWLEAFLDPTMSTVVHINRYGEAIPELAMWIVLIPICIYGAYLNLKIIVENKILIKHIV